MNTSIENLFLPPALITSLGLMLAGQASAQTLTPLHSFSGNDGAGLNGLILSGNTLYGATAGSTTFGQGTVFAVRADGSGFSTLYAFSGNDGAWPNGLILSSNSLYGTTYTGGDSAAGTVFTLNTDGTGFTRLYSFSAGTWDSSGSAYVNSDGAFPSGGLVLSSNTLYGTTGFGGTSGEGTVFGVNTDGTGFTTLHAFTAISASYPYGNSDGAFLQAGLILLGDSLYGMAHQGGSANHGTVFKVNTDGTGFRTLHSFPSIHSVAIPSVWVLLNNALYGTTISGPVYEAGTVFALNTNGTGFTTLYSFTALNNGTNSDGAGPSGLVLSGNSLYGTAGVGGNVGGGTIFSILLPVSPPQLTIISAGANIILTWPTNAAGFTLQSTTN